MILDSALGRASRVALAVALSLAAATVAQDSRSGPGCASCHAPEQAAHAGSVHGGAVTCVDCHGGNALGRTEAEGHGASFRGRVTRASIPRLCGDCHADARVMEPFGFPTDQLKKYAISRHGVAVLRNGNDKAAVCTDCHGTHAIRRHDDPVGDLHPANQAKTCNRCHADVAFMKAAGLPATAGDDYAHGAHAKAVAAGKPGAPSCTTCHGAHGATAPGAKSVADVCGRCHESEKGAFLASVHAKERTEPRIRCVDCHGAHATKALTSAELSGTCAQCHDAGGPEVQAGVRVALAVQSAERAAASALRDLEAARADLGVAARAAHLTSEVRNALARVRAAGHTVDADGLKGIADRLDVVAGEAASLAGSRREILAGRRLLAIPILIAAAAIAAGLVTVRGLFARRRARAERETAA